MAQRDSHKAAYHTTQSMRDDSDDNLGGFDSDPVEKDENEIELEKIVFGDEKGFHDDLRLHGKASVGEISEGKSREDQEGLDNTGIEGLDDADVRNINPLQSNPLG